MRVCQQKAVARLVVICAWFSFHLAMFGIGCKYECMYVCIYVHVYVSGNLLLATMEMYYASVCILCVCMCTNNVCAPTPVHTHTHTHTHTSGRSGFLQDRLS